MDLKAVDAYLRDLLAIGQFAPIDSSLNGIQVACSAKEIRKMAFAVDACMASFDRARNLGADALFVHHGLFWGAPLAVDGSHYRRVKFLLENDIALYAVHLPLDAHPIYGNNAGLARALKLREVEPFGTYRGATIGLKGVLPSPLRIDGVLRLLGIDRDSCPAVLPFGREESQSVGIVSGAAAGDVVQAVGEGLDLYLTGDALHQVYHLCLEEGVNLICGGHYQTEVWGARLVAEKLAEDTGVETTFIDVPTGL